MINARSWKNYDAIVIGSGAGGAAAAWRLSDQGLRVLVLEAGPAYAIPNYYKLHRDDWEQAHFPAKIATRHRQTAAPLQSLESKWDHLRSWNQLRGKFVTGKQRFFGRYDHVVGLGGSTLHYTGEAHRLLPAAMRMRSEFGVATDWPMSYADLEPYYEIAEAITGVAGPENDDFRPRRQPPPLPPHALSFANQRLADGARKLALGWQPNHVAALSQAYDGRPGCNYCGNCGRGCPRKDKGSADVTFIPKAVATGRCTIKSEASVLQLICSAKRTVTAITYLDALGSKHTIGAPVVVLACGAVETPRLLLASANEYAPHGIANESRQVGKNFMETLAWYNAGLHPEPLGSYRGLPSDSICWDFNAPDAIPGVVGGCRFSPQTSEADLIGPINCAERVVGGWGKAHQEAMRDQFGRVLAVGAIGEHLPNEQSYIDLDPKIKDENGILRARIHSHLSAMDLSRLEFMAKACRDILAASGVKELIEEAGTYDAFHATHVFGTCRMGEDPRDSVVDPWGRSHNWQNLYIVDASQFPSSGGGEAPSLTIEALAIRASDDIVKRLG